jgi:hypothetical protein
MGVLQSSALNQQINFHEQYHTYYMSGMRSTKHIFCVISGFRREVANICALLGYSRRTVVIPYRRFVKTYRSHPEGSSNPRRGPRRRFTDH